MSTARWERLNDLYHTAVALADDERIQFLSEACAGDPDLQADIERLVAAHERAGRFTTTIASPAPPARSSWTEAPDSRAPHDGQHRIGPYRVVRELSRGAMGVVYLADGNGPNERQVAIKVIERETRADVAPDRFHAERQLLASLDHPNIARLLNGGVTEAGQPYFVSEYVDGEPVDAYADARRLSVTERLQLFLRVCSAVAYAHQRRVVHRALKPSNVLVTPLGVVKVVDFGIGKLRDAADADAADGYTTPEQAEGRHATQASDIYALGALLQDLLTGPSPRGRSTLRSDLETIVHVALRKEPGRRYGSVDELAEDVRSNLESPAPVRARPNVTRVERPSPLRGLRTPLVSWSIAGAAAVLLGIKVTAIKDDARTTSPAPVAAETPLLHARVLVDDITDRLGDAALAGALGDAFRVGLTESPFLQIVAQRPSRTRGVIVAPDIETVDGQYTITARITAADKGDSLAVLRETAADSSEILPALARLAERVRRQLGEPLATLSATPRLDAVTTASLPALRSYAGAVRAIGAGDRAGGVRLLRNAVTVDTGFAAAYRLLATTYRDLGDRVRSADALEHAIANQERLPFDERYSTVGSFALNVLEDRATAIDAYRRILERHPRDVRALVSLASAHAGRGEYAAQESLLVRAIAVDSGVPSLYTSLAFAHANLNKTGAARRVLDAMDRRFPGARGAQVAAIGVAAAAQDWDTAEREARRRTSDGSADSLGALDGVETLASIVMAQGRLSEAEQMLRRVLALGPRGASGRRYVLAARRIAYLELRYRRSPAAAVATMNAALARSPLDRIEESDRPYYEVARLYADAGQPARANELVAQASRSRLNRQRGVDANRRWTLGAIAMADGQAWQGEIEIHGAAEAQVCPICALPDLARAYEVAGKPDSAIATYERYLDTSWQSRFETDAIELGSAMKRLGELYQQQNDKAKAAGRYTALLRLWRNADAELEPVLVDVRRRLEQTGGAVPAR
jgi:tetratricopeptide (TPR) repeat protein